MATFFNQATLSYNNRTAVSNIVRGELVEVLSASKTSVTDNYSPGEVLTYIVSVQNTGTVPYTGLSITDNLGEYDFGAGTVVPLTYVDGSAKYYVNGTLQPEPGVTPGAPLVISDISVPAGGNAMVVYSAEANGYAPLGDGAAIINTATVTGAGITTPIVAADTVSAGTDPELSISKSLSPANVAENGELTYTFIIGNTGASAAEAGDNVSVSDNFDPILNNITVTLNGAPLTAGTDYSYDTATGAFSTTDGAVTVPAATYEQDPGSGLWSVTPGTSTLVVTGTV